MKTNIKLTKNEFNRIAFLLGKSEQLILTSNEEAELRNLISKECTCPTIYYEMIKKGLIIVGMYHTMDEYNKMKI